VRRHSELGISSRQRRLQWRYARRISEVASSELRNNTAGQLERVKAREDLTVNRKPVAVLTAPQQSRRRWVSRDELLTRLHRDPGLRGDLMELAGDSTDDLGPVR
jgi:antitoxin (DNA-binding transcriptional repressor) of toxin-antitoxin stability system